MQLFMSEMSGSKRAFSVRLKYLEFGLTQAPKPEIIVIGGLPKT